MRQTGWHAVVPNEVLHAGDRCGFSGAGFGALLRWVFSIWLNPLFPAVPLGTLVANLVGGLLIGIAFSFFSQHGELPVEWRLLAVTGFLGGLTTFSTFSAEVVERLLRHDYAWAAATASLHLGGSLLLTGLGIAIARSLMARA